MNEIILDYLYLLTEKQYEGIELTKHEEVAYITIAEFCHKNEIAIEFGIEL